MDIYLTLGLIVLAYFTGKTLENRHFRSIEKREQSFIKLPTTVLKRPLKQKGNLVKAQLVSGCVVISIDYFKRIVAGLRSIIGGNISVYETLVDRARREAILRMKESCPGATQIINVRIETSSVYKRTQNGGVGSVEVLAYGTAITYQ